MIKIRTVETTGGNGKVTRKYTFVADVGKYPDGRRRQQRFTFTSKKVAEAELGKITHQRAEGTYVPRWNGTVEQLCDEYLRSAAFGRELNTAESYRNALKAAPCPARPDAGRRRDEAGHRRHAGLDAHRGTPPRRHTGHRARPALGPADHRAAVGGVRAGHR